jgi:hypothetical protein
MSTLPIHEPTALPLVGLVHVFSLLHTLLEAFVDAQREAAAAHKRYPFAEW